MEEMKFWIGDNPDLSKKVLNKLLELGYNCNGLEEISILEQNVLYTFSNGRINYGNAKDIYDNHENKAIDPYQFIKSKEIEYDIY